MCFYLLQGSESHRGPMVGEEFANVLLNTSAGRYNGNNEDPVQ
jgi:hypothetical protein